MHGEIGIGPRDEARPTTRGRSMTAASGVVVPSVLTRASRAAAGYVALTKPRIIELLLVTTLPSMMLAARGLPAVSLVIATLGFGALAAGSANVLNCYLDRDIDAVMHRTRNRPLNGDAVTPAGTLIVGLLLGIVAVTGFAVFTNAAAAIGAAAAIAFYVGVYTAVLKRRTSANIVWGGAAGCMPVIIGWSAVTGSVGWGAVVLFAVVFLWTPPHFWALAMKYRDDYARAGVPMLPVVADEATVTRRIVGYSYAMVAVSLLLWPAAHTGLAYPLVAAVAGAAFIHQAHALSRRVRSGEPARSIVLFQWSISYLTVLFLAVALDAVLR
jgi:protoheme IX farnesyltransferase